MKKTYCDICGKEMFSKEGEVDQKLVLSTSRACGEDGQITFQVNVVNSDACSRCRCRIIDAAESKYDKIKEKFGNKEEK